MTIALAGVSLPIFFTGLVALAIFVYKLGWSPAGGTYIAVHRRTRSPGPRT